MSENSTDIKSRSRKRSTKTVEPTASGEVHPGGERRSPYSTLWVVVRDIGVFLAAMTIWGAADTWATISGLPLATAVAAGDGILVGVLVAFLIHEWGHYFGAKLAGANAACLTYGSIGQLRHRFDVTANTRRDFHWMTIGGNVAHWSVVALALALVPLDSPARAALVAGTVGFALFASISELPIVARTMDGTLELDKVSSQFDQASVTRNGLLGSLGGLIFFAFVL